MQSLASYEKYFFPPHFSAPAHWPQRPAVEAASGAAKPWRRTFSGPSGPLQLYLSQLHRAQLIGYMKQLNVSR